MANNAEVRLQDGESFEHLLKRFVRTVVTEKIIAQSRARVSVISKSEQHRLAAKQKARKIRKAQLRESQEDQN